MITHRFLIDVIDHRLVKFDHLNHFTIIQTVKKDLWFYFDFKVWCPFFFLLRSSLTWRDVQHIIVRSARHAPERNPLTGGLWVKNKAGLWFSRYFGFGLMDGGMMVHLAKHWNTVPSQLRCEVDGTEKNRFETQFLPLAFWLFDSFSGGTLSIIVSYYSTTLEL